MCEGGCGGHVSYFFYECQYYCTQSADCWLTNWGIGLFFVIGILTVLFMQHLPKTWWNI